MSNLIITVLTVIVNVLTALIAKLTVATTASTDVKFEAVDVEFELAHSGNDQLDFFAILDAVIEEVVEVATPVEVSNFDDAVILAALGLATPVVETVEVVEEVAETVEVLGTTFVIRYMTNVDVRFSGRSHIGFENVDGYLFQGNDGTSDFLIRVQKPITLAGAREWMSRNGETKRYNTKVFVTPTRKF